MGNTFVIDGSGKQLVIIEPYTLYWFIDPTGNAIGMKGLLGNKRGFGMLVQWLGEWCPKIGYKEAPLLIGTGGVSLWFIWGWSGRWLGLWGRCAVLYCWWSGYL